MTARYRLEIVSPQLWFVMPSRTSGTVLLYAVIVASVPPPTLPKARSARSLNIKGCHCQKLRSAMYYVWSGESYVSIQYSVSAGCSGSVALFLLVNYFDISEAGEWKQRGNWRGERRGKWKTLSSLLALQLSLYIAPACERKGQVSTEQLSLPLCCVFLFLLLVLSLSSSLLHLFYSANNTSSL